MALIPTNMVRRLMGAVLITPVLLALTACGGANTSDLQEFVTEVKARKAGRIEPLPTFKPFETFAYAAVAEKDPFAPWVTERAPQTIVDATGAVKTVRPQGISPDFDRRKELLEQYPLDSLAMVGTLNIDDELWAIVADPDKVVHRVKAGNYLGQNFGKIVEVQEDRLAVRELVVDGLGDWQVREASLALAE